MYETYYLLNLALVIAYTIPLVIFLSRYGSRDQRVGAIRRWLCAMVGWAFCNAFISHMGHLYLPSTAFTVFRWLSFLWLLPTPAGAEVFLSFVTPVNWRHRLFLYFPYAALYASIIFLPEFISPRLYGIPLGYPESPSPIYLLYMIYSGIILISLLAMLGLSTHREKDPVGRQEKFLVLVGGIFTALAQIAVIWCVVKLGQDYEHLNILAMSIMSLVYFWALKRHGRILHPWLMFNTTARMVPTGMAQVRDGRIVWANWSLASMLGLDGPADLTNLPLRSLLGRSREASVGDGLAVSLARGEVTNQEVTLANPWGTSAAECLVSSALFEQGRPEKGALLVFTDLRKTKHMQEELGRSEARYRALVEQSMDIIAVAQDQQCVFLNQAASKLLGWPLEEMLGRGMELFFHPADLPRALEMWQRLMGGLPTPETIEVRLLTKSGEYRWLELVGRLVDWEGREAVQVVSRDITDRKAREEETLNGERLQAAIETAGAACHELNQPLQSVLMKLELALMKLEPDDPLREYLEGTLAEVNRLSDITHKLNRITSYRTVQYLEKARILDIAESARDRAS